MCPGGSRALESENHWIKGTRGAPQNATELNSPKRGCYVGFFYITAGKSSFFPCHFLKKKVSKLIHHPVEAFILQLMCCSLKHWIGNFTPLIPVLFNRSII